MSDEEGSPPASGLPARPSGPVEPPSGRRSAPRWRIVLRLSWALCAASSMAILFFTRHVRGDAGIPVALLLALVMAIGALLALAGAIGDGLALLRSPADRSRTTWAFFLAECAFVLAFVRAFAPATVLDESFLVALIVAIGSLLALAGAIGDGLALLRSPADRSRTTWAFFLAECAFLLAVGAVVVLDGSSHAAEERRRARREAVVRPEPPFVVDLPPGWRREENDERLGRTVYAGAKDGAQTWLFSSGDGGYISVQVDGREGVLRPDAVWRVAVRGDGLAIEAEGAPCRRASEPAGVTPICPEANGQLDVRVLAAKTASAELEPVEVKGHTYRIQFGNVGREEGVDLEPFRRILGTFRAKQQGCPAVPDRLPIRAR